MHRVGIVSGLERFWSHDDRYGLGTDRKASGSAIASELVNVIKGGSYSGKVNYCAWAIARHGKVSSSENVSAPPYRFRHGRKAGACFDLMSAAPYY
jgi:hypothetical protein